MKNADKTHSHGHLESASSNTQQSEGQTPAQPVRKRSRRRRLAAW
jgi:hypothetical protein